MILSRPRCLEALTRSATVIAEIAAEHPSAEVPRYPGSDVEALLRHVITIHEWVAETLETLSQEPLTQHPPEETLTGDALLQRFDTSWRRLHQVLDDADESASVWTFGVDGTVAFWVRRMAHETTLHAWDAESVIGPHPAPIPLDLAVTGLGEGLHIHVARPLRRREIGGSGQTVGLTCTDVDADWTITLQPVGVAVSDGVGHPDARLAGTASDLWLAVGGRTPTEPLSRFGDESVLGMFERALAEIRAAM